MANKIVNIKSFLQVNSLVRASQLLTADYLGAQISMTTDEVDPREAHHKPGSDKDEILFAHGTYIISVNPDYNKYSNPDDPAYDKTKTTPDEKGMKYEASLDKSLLPLDPEFYDGCNEPYYFAATSGVQTVKFGHNWVNDTSALVVAGDSCTLDFACHWEAQENTDTTHQDFISWPEEPEYDPSDASYVSAHDYKQADWDGTCWGRVDNLYDRNVIVALPLPIESDQGKILFSHTDSVMSVAQKLVLTTNAIKYAVGDTVYIATGATELPADPQADVNFSREEVTGTFDVAIELKDDGTVVNADKFIDVIDRVEATAGVINNPDEALEVSTLIGSVAFQKQFVSAE